MYVKLSLRGKSKEKLKSVQNLTLFDLCPAMAGVDPKNKTTIKEI